MVSLKGSIQTTKAMLDEGMIEADLRPYLGMSQIGHSCQRYLWLSFHWAYRDSFSKRIGRLFWRGHREEPEIVKELKKIGIKCWGDQTACVTGEGHIRGHCDGMCSGVPEAPKTDHLLEFKTASDKMFKATVKKGVEDSKPVYFAQCQLYMKFLKLTRTLFIMVNKNDDSYYIERIRYDAQAAKFLVKKGEAILMADKPVPPPYAATWWGCKFCSAKDVCRGNVLPLPTCRTCIHVEIEPEGEWSCKLADGVHIPEDVQRNGCPNRVGIKL